MITAPEHLITLLLPNTKCKNGKQLCKEPETHSHLVFLR